MSKVARSAEWVRLEFENQKPLQTLVGPLVQAGAAFAVSPAQATVLTKGGGDYFTMEWSVSPIAVIQEIVAGKLILTRALNSGALTVAVTQSVTSAVTELKR